jgi:hypothetical protein
MKRITKKSKPIERSRKLSSCKGVSVANRINASNWILANFKSETSLKDIFEKSSSKRFLNVKTDRAKKQCLRCGKSVAAYARRLASTSKNTSRKGSRSVSAKGSKNNSKNNSRKTSKERWDPIENVIHKGTERRTERKPPSKERGKEKVPTKIV